MAIPLSRATGCETLLLLPALGARFRKARREHDRCSDVPPTASCKRVEGRIARQTQHGSINIRQAGHQSKERQDRPGPPFGHG